MAYFSGMSQGLTFQYCTDGAVLGKIQKDAKQMDLTEVTSNATKNERLYLQLRSKMWEIVRYAPGVDHDLVDGRFISAMIHIRLNFQCETFEDFLDLIRAASFTSSFKRRPVEGNLFEPMERLTFVNLAKLRRIDEILEKALKALTYDFIEDFQREAKERIDAKTKAREAAKKSA